MCHYGSVKIVSLREHLLYLETTRKGASHKNNANVWFRKLAVDMSWQLNSLSIRLILTIGNKWLQCKHVDGVKMKMGLSSNVSLKMIWANSTTTANFVSLKFRNHIEKFRNHIKREFSISVQKLGCKYEGFTPMYHIINYKYKISNQIILSKYIYLFLSNLILIYI